MSPWVTSSVRKALTGVGLGLAGHGELAVPQKERPRAFAVGAIAIKTVAAVTAPKITVAGLSRRGNRGKRIEPRNSSRRRARAAAKVPASHRRPRYGPGGRRLGESPSRVEHTTQAQLQNADLVRVEKIRKRPRQLTFFRATQCALDVAAHLRRQRLTRKIPDHRAQLGVGMKSETVVDDPNPVFGVEEAVTRFAVGVVRDDIEKRHAQPGLTSRLLRTLFQPKSCTAPTPCGASRRTTVGGMRGHPSALLSS